ncbi:MAG: hypothetical protein EAX96_18180 [Candidatus Lokiarchaeota archaeon]|nr:hypothetical protein [Candidatus Lokiarchaeota archaeon]
MSNNFFMDLYGFLAYQPPLLLLICTLFAGSWFLYQIIAKPEEEEESPKLLKIIDILGMFIGVLIIIPSGITMFFIPNAFNTVTGQFYVIRNFTKILVIVMGMGLFLKPLKDVPWASLIGGGAGLIVILLLALFIDRTPLTLLTGIPWIAQILPWVFLIIFGIIFVFIYMMFKFAGDMMSLIGKLFASKIGSFIMMGVGLVQLILIIIPVYVDGTLTAGWLSIIMW